MAGSSQDNAQWLSVTEETLFLHDGLIRVTDLVELPLDVNTVHEVDHEVVTFDSKSPAELTERLVTVCGTQNNAYARLLVYRLNALRGYWHAHQQMAFDEQSDRDSATHEETIALLKKQGLWKEPDPAPFSTRVSLLLVLPLLQSQSKFDPALCGVTAQLLLNCLQDCPPLSLTKEPSDCLNGLESLLSTWLGEKEGQEGQIEEGVADPLQRENAASALVALTCARGQLKTFIHTVHLLQRVSGLSALPVRDILQKLIEMDGGPGQPASILGSKHIVCWGFEDMLSATDKDAATAAAAAAATGHPLPSSQDKEKEKSSEVDIGRSITCDGFFLYTTNNTGKGLAKIGTGLQGTLRGYLYGRNTEMMSGFVAWGDGVLIHRSLEYDKETNSKDMAQVIDIHTLKPVKMLHTPPEYESSATMTTISLCSDGAYFYWVWCPGSVSDKGSKGQNIYLDTFRIDAKELIVMPLRPRVCLQRKEEGSSKTLNETLLSRLRPYRSGATAATLVALGGNEAQATRKEDTTTSLGLPIKMLLKTPICCDGSSLILLTPVPGSTNSSAARSLFGSGTSLASLRSLVTNLCFNVEDGQFVSRADLIDAPTCALARGALVAGLGVCYDVTNNMIWTCSTDWVDQYYNPGHQARHHILSRLHIDPLDVQTPSDEASLVPVSTVIRQLLRHVGSMCVHQLHSDLLHTPLGSYILQQHPPDLAYMKRVCDILEQAIDESDTQVIICSLIIFQLIYKLSTFKKEMEKEKELIARSSGLVWKILDKYQDFDGSCRSSEGGAILHEACAVVSASLPTLNFTDRNHLLHKLLTKGDVASLAHLRDMILVSLADQLRSQSLETEDMENVRLNEDFVHYILKMAVRESCILLRQCQTTDKFQFEQLLASVPMASPCLRYLMALQSQLLRECLLFLEAGGEEEEEDEEQESASRDSPRVKSQESYTRLQTLVQGLAVKIFAGSYEVLEVVLETCNTIIHSKVTDLEYWLAGLERVAKATILGHLLPVLLTTMTHPNLRCLPMADALMPQLVQLVVLTSQAALLVKSQVQAIRHDNLLDVSNDNDLSDLIGDLNLESFELDNREEQGFLAGLKIPAPWATGKTVETIHPVRDNYKFKETVHIPGARCLYLRFDPRCTSQYDYDKVVIYAGPNSSSRKVAEYGGNTFGYGSRSVLGAGWPKDLVKVEGDTVTLTFEMRSGREHNTPDKAMWGFLVTVRAQESAEEVSNGLPFLADLALGLSVLACTLLRLLYQGPQRTADEDLCQHLLKSKLLQRCVWQDKSNEEHQVTLTPPPGPADLPIEEDAELHLPSSPRLKRLPRIRLPAEIIYRLRAMSERQAPQVRPSIKEVIRPDILEEAVLSAALKHLSLTDTVQHIVSHEQDCTPEYWLLKDVMGETYRRLYAMIRQLQTLAELESRWRNEVEDIRAAILQPHEVFFVDYHLIENKTQELGCLCFLKDIEFDPLDLESAVTELREKLESELALTPPSGGVGKQMPKTSAVVHGLLERLNLLLHVTIAPEAGQLTRSMSQMPELVKPMASVMVRSDTDVLRSTPPYTRSLSAPSDMAFSMDDSILDIIKLQRRRQAQKKGPHLILHDLVDAEARDRPPHVTLIEQLFSFIGSNPEKAVSCESFLSAARVRMKRGRTRQQALVHIKELLTAASRVGGATHLVAAVTSVLQHGPRVEELTCGGMATEVREAFAETMTSVIQLAARFPIACCNSIGLLCIVPYTRAEEKCLVRCGLVHLLDRLCSLTNYRSDSPTNSDAQSTSQRVSAMAWAGFQVLSNRCVMWETEDGAIIDELEHSGLARQVSTLLTNHLARATECSGNEAAGNEALQEVLTLLNNLSRSRMGRAILSQPACVARLLSLLLDQRPSPKLVLIILQLCRVALPLMSTEDCDKVDLPTWGHDLPATYAPDADKPLTIASLLLAKLGDFLVPGGQTTISSRRPSVDVHTPPGGTAGSGGDKDKDDRDVHDGRLSVFVHKREDQSSHEVIQPLLSSDSRPFLRGGGANMERVVRMDREMTKHGKAELTTEDAMSALRRAAKWAQMGLVVSTGQPLDGSTSDNSSTDKKKTAVEVVCKEKNAELARTDPIRPFISAHVANSMAAEVIALLHSLLTAPETHAAQTWATAVEKVMSQALSCLPLLLGCVEEVGSPRCHRDQLMAMAKQANAALAALGGFEETIKPGCTVQMTGPGLCECMGTVVSVSEQTGLATVSLEPPSDHDYLPARYSDTVQVPITRLKPPRNEPLPLHRLSMSESIVMAVQSLLLPQNSSGSPLSQPLPIHGADGNSLANQICRVVSEIRTRACKVLACHLRDLSFASAFIQHSSAAIDVLKSLAKDCSIGERVKVTEAQCQRLRMLYRDCAKPPPPPSKVLNRPVKEIVWDTVRPFPPVRACLFSHAMTGVTFLGDPSAGSGFPRGTIVFASQPIPQQAPSFYWELEICSFGDTPDESGPIISFGFMPAAEKKDGAWTNPVGSCLFHNNGRAVHYNGSSLLQWKSVRLDLGLNAGDIAGIGWERQGDAAPLPGHSVRGLVYFTYNGRKLASTLDDVAGGMWPVVHIQKKNTRIKANFGSRPFAYAEGLHHRNAADECHDVTQEIRETFGALPFCMGSDSDSEGTAATSLSTTDSSVELKTPPGPPCRTATVPKSLREYNSDQSVHYKLLPCFENFTTTGPDLRTQSANVDDESDVEDGDGDEPTEDHYALLVKAWEQKVFPTIRRRFRNEAERKDGLEQIRGALQLGMTDIARQTVEFLYEENGGMPRDLHLPTIDDIREELAKFTIERVRKGTTVVVQTPATGTSVLPKYAVRGMMKTFGLTGVVLDVDQPNELVQVEAYLRSEGVLIRYWYPIDMLERPPAGYRKSSIVGHQVLDTSNVHLHRELLRVESVLARMYCRSALLELISQCNSPAMGFPSCPATLGSAMAASAALLQELDVENLQLLSNELLATPQPHGCVVASSLLTSQMASQCLNAHLASLSDVLYNQSGRLREELRIAIARAANQGEDYLIELSNQICMCLQTAPEMFAYEELPVTETKLNMDIYFPGAAFLVISCKADPKAVRKETSLYKSPWARIYTYRGSRVKRTGQPTKQEVVCYPHDTSSSSNQSDQYAPVVVPCDLVHVRLGVSPPPGIIVTIHAIPPQFPLAVTYIETLVSQRYNFEHRQTDSEHGELGSSSGGAGTALVGKDHGATSPWRNFETVVISPPVLLHVSELLGSYLWRTDIPAMVKESTFHLMAQCLRMLHHSEIGMTPSTQGSTLQPLSPHLSPSLALLMQLQSELRKLYEEETKSWSTVSTPCGTGMGLGVGDSGRFTTYFHALMEVSLAVAEVTAPITSGSAASLSAIETLPSSGGSTQSMPTSPMSAGKRKKLKAKRERGSTTPKRSGSPRRLSESDATSPPASSSLSGSSISSGGTVSASSSSSGGSVALSGGKPEDMLWFHRALTLSQILRHLVYGDLQGQGVTNDAIADAAQSLTKPTAHSRLLVVTCIPTQLDEQLITAALRKACNANGGLYMEEIYVPTEEVEIVTQAATDSAASEPTQAPTAKQPAGSQAPLETVTQQKETPKKNTVKTKRIKGYAVVELRSRTKVEAVRKALFRSKTLIDSMTLGAEDLVDIQEEMLTISTVNQNLIAEPHSNANTALENYCVAKLIMQKDSGVQELNDASMIALTEIFHSCFISEQRLSLVETRYESGYICLSRDQISMQVTGNLLFTFLTAIRAPKKTFSEQVTYILRRYGIPKIVDKEDMDPKSLKGRILKKGFKPSPKEKMALSPASRSTLRDKKVKPKDGEKMGRDTGASDSTTKPTKETVKEEEKLLTLDGFLSYVLDKIKQDVRAVWRGLLASGFDLHFGRCACVEVSQAQQMSLQWTLEMDSALVSYHSNLCRHLAVGPSRLHPHEVYLNEAELASAEYSCLQGVPLESLRLRFALLQSLNNTLETFFLPLVDLRPALGNAYSRSTAQLLANARGIMFYDTKTVFLNRILNATAQRKPDQAAPEITLDPLENVGGERKTPMATLFCQAFRQLSNISSSQFNVRLAAGGDPTYSFNVRMTGEEVHGTSGSFRHLLWQVARELESNILDLLMPCPSAASHKNKGKYILKPGPMTYAEEKLLQFFGQLLGITIRADIPLGLDLLPVFWKNLVGLQLDPITDLQEADILTYNYIKKFEMAESESDLQLAVADNYPHFVYTMLNGQEVELISNGHKVPVNWENRQQYVDCIRSLRMSELRLAERMVALRSGMASILPIQFLPLMSAVDMELRTCGLPQVNLDFLRAHTMYQVGLMETDTHIQYFWTALEGFSQDELRKFIKFACNQERIPQSCPCRDGGADTAHVPPYPMKIAPPDGSGSPDSRYIRVETCMFMIKLPQYSSQRIMSERLLYAIHCREDPLSG